MQDFLSHQLIIAMRPFLKARGEGLTLPLAESVLLGPNLFRGVWSQLNAWTFRGVGIGHF